MLKNRLLNISRSLMKLILPSIFKILIKLNLNRRVINFLDNESYFSNKSQNFSKIIEQLIGKKKLIALDVGAQGGFNSDQFFHSRYNIYFDQILIEPLNSGMSQASQKKNLIKKGLWSSKEKKKLYFLGNRPGSSSMFKPNTKKFYLHNIKVKDYEKFNVTKTIEVDCDTLNNSLTKIHIKELDYLKIDTQGAEYEILKGLGEFRPLFIRIEAHVFSMYHDVPSWHKLLNYLYELKYVAIDWKGIGSHSTRIPAELDMIFIPNFEIDEGINLILKNKEKFMCLLLIFGQINILKDIMKKLNITNSEIDKLQDLYFK